MERTNASAEHSLQPALRRVVNLILVFCLYSTPSFCSRLRHQVQALPNRNFSSAMAWGVCGCAGYFLGQALDIYPTHSFNQAFSNCRVSTPGGGDLSDPQGHARLIHRAVVWGDRKADFPGPSPSVRSGGRAIRRSWGRAEGVAAGVTP